MALKKCVNCGKSYSDSVEACPHCGYKPYLVLCPECGQIVSLEDKVCPFCGFDVAKEPQFIEREKIDALINEIGKKMDNSKTVDELENTLGELKLFEKEVLAQTLLEKGRKTLEDRKTEIRNKAILNDYVKMFENAESVEDYESVLAGLSEIKGFECADEYIGKCREIINVRKLEAAKVALVEAGSLSALEAVCRSLEGLESGSERDNLLQECRERISETKYQDLKAAYDKAGDKASLSALLPRLDELKGYKDTESIRSDIEGKISAIKAKDRKKIIGIVAALSAVIAAVAVFITVIKPNMDYNKAEQALQSGNYKDAIAMYTALGDYKDSTEKIKQAKHDNLYAEAKALMANNDYVTGIETLKEVAEEKEAKALMVDGVMALINKGDYVTAANLYEENKLASEVSGSNKKAVEYARGIAFMKEKKYISAESSFKAAGDYKDAASKAADAHESVYRDYYSAGMSAMSGKKWDEAVRQFTNAGEYSDAKKMVNAAKLMKAEEQYQKGYLNTAQKLFKEVPADTSYNGITAKSRLATLTKFKSFLPLCGKWSSTSGKITSRQHHKSTGLWDEWYENYSSGGATSMDVTCVIGSDGKVTVKCSTILPRYTNYSSLSKYLKYGNVYVTVNHKMTKVPNGLSVGSNTKMTYSKNVITMAYKYTDKTESMYFNYIYKSTFKFKRTTTY